MALSFSNLRTLWGTIFRDDAPAGALQPSVDLETRTDLLDSIEQAIDQAVASIPVGPSGAQGVQGIQGVPGPVGPAGLEWRGTWAAATSYALDDAVGYNGASYFCILARTGNVANANPVSDTTHWALLAAQGATGPAGAQGAAGAQGPVGPQGIQGPAGVVASLTSASVVKATPAAELIYGINEISGGSGSVKLPSGAGRIIGSSIYVSAAFASTLVYSYAGDAKVRYAGGVNGAITSFVVLNVGNYYRFTYLGDDYWLAEKTVQSYREFRKRLTQSGTSNPTFVASHIDELTNSVVGVSDVNYRNIVLFRNDVGNYSIIIRTNPSVTTNLITTEIGFSDAKARVLSSNIGSDGVYNFLEYIFETRDGAGVLSDNQLNLTNVYIKIYA